jgi:hypothetical protein
MEKYRIEFQFKTVSANPEYRLAEKAKTQENWKEVLVFTSCKLPEGSFKKVGQQNQICTIIECKAKPYLGDGYLVLLDLIRKVHVEGVYLDEKEARRLIEAVDAWIEEPGTTQPPMEGQKRAKQTGPVFREASPFKEIFRALKNSRNRMEHLNSDQSKEIRRGYTFVIYRILLGLEKGLSPGQEKEEVLMSLERLKKEKDLTVIGFIEEFNPFLRESEFAIVESYKPEKVPFNPFLESEFAPGESYEPQKVSFNPFEEPTPVNNPVTEEVLGNLLQPFGDSLMGSVVNCSNPNLDRSESTDEKFVLKEKEEMEAKKVERISTVLKELGDEFVKGNPLNSDDKNFQKILEHLSALSAKHSQVFTIEHLFKSRDEIVSDQDSNSIIACDPIKFGKMFSDTSDWNWKTKLFRRASQGSEMLDWICVYSVLLLLPSTKRKELDALSLLSNLNKTKLFSFIVGEGRTKFQEQNNREYTRLLLDVDLRPDDRNLLLEKLIDKHFEWKDKAKIIFLLWEECPNFEIEPELEKVIKKTMMNLLRPENGLRDEIVNKIHKWFNRSPTKLVELGKIENSNVHRAIRKWILKAFINKEQRQADTEVIKQVFFPGPDNPEPHKNLIPLLKYLFETKASKELEEDRNMIIEPKGFLQLREDIIKKLRQGDRQMYLNMGVVYERNEDEEDKEKERRDDEVNWKVIIGKLADCGISNIEKELWRNLQTVKEQLRTEQRQAEFDKLLGNQFFSKYFKWEHEAEEKKTVSISELNCESELKEILKIDQRKLLDFEFYKWLLTEHLTPILQKKERLNITSENKETKDWIESKVKTRIRIPNDLEGFGKHVARFLFNHIKKRLQNWHEWEVVELEQFQLLGKFDDERSFGIFLHAFDLRSESVKKDQWSNYIVALFRLKCDSLKLIKVIMDAHEPLQSIDKDMKINENCRRELREISQIVDRRSFEKADLQKVKSRRGFESIELSMLRDALDLVKHLEKANSLKQLLDTYQHRSSTFRLHDILIEGELINYQLTFRQLKNFEEVAKFIKYGDLRRKNSYNDPLEFIKLLVGHLKMKGIDLQEVLSLKENLLNCFIKYSTDHRNQTSNRVYKVLKECHFVILYDEKDSHLYHYYADLDFDSTRLEKYQKELGFLNRQISSKKMYSSSDLDEAQVKLLIAGEVYDQVPREDNDSYLNYYYLLLMDKIKQIVKLLSILRNRGLLLNVSDAIKESEASDFVMANSSDLSIKIFNDLDPRLPQKWDIKFDRLDYLIEYLDNLIQKSATSNLTTSKYHFLWLMKPNHLLNLAKLISNYKESLKEGQLGDQEIFNKAESLISYYLPKSDSEELLKNIVKFEEEEVTTTLQTDLILEKYLKQGGHPMIENKEPQNKRMRVYFINQLLKRNERLEDLWNLEGKGPHFVLWGNRETSPDELQRFVVAAFLDDDVQSKYIVFDWQLIKRGIREDLLHSMINHQSNSKLVKAAQIIICLSEEQKSRRRDLSFEMSENESAKLDPGISEIAELRQFAEDFNILTEEETKKLYSEKLDKPKEIKWVCSNFPGQGKSKWVRDRKGKMMEVELLGDFNDRDFGECFKIDCSQETTYDLLYINIHLTKVSEKVVDKLDQFLYQTCYRKQIPQFDCILPLPEGMEIFIEVSNDNREILEKDLSFYHLISKERVIIEDQPAKKPSSGIMHQGKDKEGRFSQKYLQDSIDEKFKSKHEQMEIPLNKSQNELLKKFINGESNKSKVVPFETLLKTGSNLIVNNFYRLDLHASIAPSLQPDEKFNMSHKIPKFNSQDKECVYIKKRDGQPTVRYHITQSETEMRENGRQKMERITEKTAEDEEVVEINLNNPSNDYQSIIEEMFITTISQSNVWGKERVYLRKEDDFRSRCEKFENNKNYILTPDNFLKIVKVIQKVEYNMPLILCGNTGCGKTYLITFIAECIFQENLRRLTMHSGTDEMEFKRIIEAHVKILSEDQVNSKRKWIFFDEFNASHLMPLVTQLILERRMSWIPDKEKQAIPDNLVFVAACNPYNLRRLKDSSREGGYKKDHNVNPLPQNLFYHIWNFGELEREDEKKYLIQMIESEYSNSNLGKFDYDRNEEEARAYKRYMMDVIAEFVMDCHDEIRRNSTSTNAVSLRDMTRFIKMNKELQNFVFQPEEALTLALYLVYFIRIENVEKREDLDKKLKITGVMSQSVLTNFQKIANNFQEDLLKLKVYDPKAIIFNSPLKENLIALYCAIVCNIPIVIFGPPGTSKTLSISLIEELFKSNTRLSTFPSNTKYFNFNTLNGFWSVNLWGSYLTTTRIIMDTFQKAKRIKSLNGGRVCIHFEEMSLAETAPGYPLKCLHNLLEETSTPQERVQFIGSANCALDMSNGNRVLIVSRGELKHQDLLSAFIGSDENSVFTQDHWIREITIFINSYKNYKAFEMDKLEDPEFHGIRDLYSVVKFIKKNKDNIESLFLEDEKRKAIRALFEVAVMRNFSGRLVACNGFDSLDKDKRCEVLASQWFIRDLWGNDYQSRRKQNLKVTDLIRQNLVERDSKHLMFITELQVVEEIITEQIKSFIAKSSGGNPSNIHTICGTNSQEDVISIISKLPKIVKEPSVLILIDTPHVWGALYDLLNEKISEKERRFCYLYYDNNKPKIEVHAEFKCIVLYNKKRYTLPMDGAFLGRFEKYLIQKTDILTQDQLEQLQRLKVKYMGYSEGMESSKVQMDVKGIMVHNLSEDLLISAIVKGGCTNSAFDENENGKRGLLNSIIKEEKTEGLIKTQDSLVEKELHRMYSKNYCIARFFDETRTDIEKKTKQVSSGCESTLKKKLVSEQLDAEMKVSHKRNLFEVVEIDPEISLRKLPLVFTFTNLSMIKKQFQDHRDYQTKFRVCELNEIRSFNISEVESKLERLMKAEEEEQVCFTFIFATKDDIHFLNTIRYKLEKVFQKKVRAEKDRNRCFQMLVLVTYMKSENVHSSPPVVNINLCSQGWDIQVLDNLFKDQQYDQFVQNLCLTENEYRSRASPDTGSLESKCRNAIEFDIKRAIKKLHYFDHSREILDILQGSSFYKIIVEVSKRSYQSGAINGGDSLIIDRVIDELLQCYRKNRLSLDFCDSIDNFLERYDVQSCEELIRLMGSSGLIDYLVKLSIFDKETINQKIKELLIPIIESPKRLSGKEEDCRVILEEIGTFNYQQFCQVIKENHLKELKAFLKTKENLSIMPEEDSLHDDLGKTKKELGELVVTLHNSFLKLGESTLMKIFKIGNVTRRLEECVYISCMILNSNTWNQQLSGASLLILQHIASSIIKDLIKKLQDKKKAIPPTQSLVLLTLSIYECYKVQIVNMKQLLLGNPIEAQNTLQRLKQNFDSSFIFIRGQCKNELIYHSPYSPSVMLATDVQAALAIDEMIVGHTPITWKHIILLIIPMHKKSNLTVTTEEKAITSDIQFVYEYLKYLEPTNGKNRTISAFGSADNRSIQIQFKL